MFSVSLYVFVFFFLLKGLNLIQSVCVIFLYVFYFFVHASFLRKGLFCLRDFNLEMYIQNCVAVLFYI